MTEDLPVVLLRHLLGDAGVRHVARCVEAAEREEVRRNGWSPPRSLDESRELLRRAARAAAARVEARSPGPDVAAAGPHPAPRPHPGPAAAGTSARGSAEVPHAPGSPVWSQIDWTPTKEAAAMLGCTDRNVRDLCARGVFATARRDAGGAWVIDRTELLERRDEEARA